MKIDKKDIPRTFKVGLDRKIEISHVADIALQSNEQVTFISNSGAELDFVRKDWGYYATPSINRRLKSFGFQTALVQNTKGQIYILVIEPGKLLEFEKYCHAEKQKVLMWLDRVSCYDSTN